jgi:hypothetical protein
LLLGGLFLHFSNFQRCNKANNLLKDRKKMLIYIYCVSFFLGNNLNRNIKGL